MKSVKIFAVAALALAAAACQTTRNYGGTDITQQVYGNAQPAVPANWQRTTLRSGAIVFGCKVGQCDDPGAIGYRATQSQVNTEMLVRRKVITANLLNEMGRSFSHMTSGRIQTGNVRQFSGRNAVGFEATSSMHTASGTFYGATRSVVTGNETRTVTGVATSPAKARRNLQRGIQGAN